MGRVSFALTSLVAAVPAGLLAAIIVMEGFLKYVGNMSPLLMFLAGATLGLSGFVVLIPAGILVFGGPKKKKTPAEKPAKEKAKSPEEAQPIDAGSSGAIAIDDSESDILQTSGEAKVVDSDIEVDADLDSDNLIEVDEELDATTAFSSSVSSPDIELSEDDAIIDDDLDDMNTLDEIDEEVIIEDDDDEPKPKKRR